MNIRNPRLLRVALILAIPSAFVSHGAVIPGVTIQSVSSEFVSGTDQRRATNLVNGSGLFGDAHTTVAQGAMWLTSPTTTNAFTNAFVTFDLGSVHTLDQMKVWNYNEAGTLTQRGIQLADLLTAGEDLVFTTNFPGVLFNRAPGAFTNFAQTINLGGIPARYVRLNVLTNHYVSGAAENRAGLSKVQFIDNSVAPTLLFASRSFSGDRVTVLFSEPMLASTATSATNYSIRSGADTATIFSVAMDSFPDRVVLQTSTLDSNQVYTLTANNVRDAANISGIPTDSEVAIEPELALWLKADSGVTADANGFVSQWTDQSGNGNHALQTNSVSMPTLLSGALNANPVLHFDGVTNFLEIADSPGLLIRGDLTIYAVALFEDYANFNGIIAKTLANQPAPFDFYLNRSTTGPLRFIRGNGSGNSTVSGTTTPVAGQYYILSAVVNGTNGTQYLNGAVNGSGPLIAGVGDGGRPVRIGTRDDFATRLKGTLAEVILIRGAVSFAERTAIDNYLGNKYGIPVVSLNITQQPAAAQQPEGRSATFTVSVTANSSQISYQWQKNLVDIPGATNATYTTPTLTLADNNGSYRVRVSIPGTSLLSDSAKLTVLLDQEPPTLLSAGKTLWSPSEIVVVFSESMSVASATNAESYSLDNGATVTAAAAGGTPDKVILSTSGLADGVSYSLTVQNVQDMFNNTIVQTSVPVGFYPALPVLWLKADAGVTADGFGRVSEWDDQSGNFNHATQFSGTDLMPILVTNGFNGQPAIHFDGTNSYLLCPSSASLAITGDMSVYAVARFTDFANFNGIVGKTSLNIPAPYDFYTLQGFGNLRFYRGNGGANAQVASGGAPSLGVPHVISVTMQATNVAHFLDGQANGTGVLVTSIGDNGDPLGIGTRNDLGTKMKGDLAEIMIFDAALLDADRQAIDAYLGAKYGIVVGALPMISLPAISGSNIVLSWPAAGVNFMLESTPNLSASSWAPVTNAVTSSGGVNSVTVNATNAQQFYRLHKP